MSVTAHLHLYVIVNYNVRKVKLVGSIFKKLVKQKAPDMRPGLLRFGLYVGFGRARLLPSRVSEYALAWQEPGPSRTVLRARANRHGRR